VTMPDPNAPLSAEVIAAHAQAERDGEDGYIDPTRGLFVFTAAYLAARGPCCESNCRHCPFG
jgi:hypothetical protein